MPKPQTGYTALFHHSTHLKLHSTLITRIRRFLFIIHLQVIHRMHRPNRTSHYRTRQRDRMRKIPHRIIWQRKETTQPGFTRGYIDPRDGDQALGR